MQYGTSRVIYKIVPHFDANDYRQYIHQVMSLYGSSGKKVVMVTDRSGHHLNPIEGFWRRMKEVIGARQCFEDLHQLYQRTRQVLDAHQQRPIYEFSW